MRQVARPPVPGHTSSKLPLGFLLCCSLLALSCGYHTAGHSTAIPQEVRTIAIPAFVNQTHTYRIEQMLTAAVVREMTTRTHYHVIQDPAAGADATLSGSVLSAYTTPLTYDSTTGRAASVLVVISMSVSFADKTGKLLYRNPAYLFREQYEISRDPNSFFEEDTPALARLSRDFAQTLVSNILEGF